ncbi:MAG: S24/S26 family peptidase [Clostridia bacterium]|nr:S24/S26 family peptidase [Clostridia bacterium]
MKLSDDARRVIDARELFDACCELIDQGESVTILAHGSSMTPFLADGRDGIVLSPITREIVRGDIVLYRRDSGQYVVHRVFRAREHDFDVIGDAQTFVEVGVRREQLRAVASTVVRKGKRLQKGDLLWEFFEHVWLTLRHLRPAMIRAYGAVRRRKTDR